MATKTVPNDNPTKAETQEADSDRPMKLAVSALERWFMLRELAGDKTKGMDAVRARTQLFTVFEEASTTDKNRPTQDFYSMGKANPSLTSLAEEPIYYIQVPRRLIDAAVRFLDGVIDEGRLSLHESRFLLSLAETLRSHK